MGAELPGERIHGQIKTLEGARKVGPPHLPGELLTAPVDLYNVVVFVTFHRVPLTCWDLGTPRGVNLLRVVLEKTDEVDFGWEGSASGLCRPAASGGRLVVSRVKKLNGGHTNLQCKWENVNGSRV